MLQYLSKLYELAVHLKVPMKWLDSTVLGSYLDLENARVTPRIGS